MTDATEPNAPLIDDIHELSGGDPLDSGGDPPRGEGALVVEEEEEDDATDEASQPVAVSSSNARRPTAFQPAHALKFGLEIVARDTSTSPPRVTAALCLFCKHFGREPKAGAKRRATTNFKYFKGVFRTDQYLQHHRLQHPIKWAEYEAASVREKQAFFPRYLMPVEEVDLRNDVKPRAKKQRRGANDAEADASDKSESEKHQVNNHRSPEKDDKRIEFVIPSALVALLLGDQTWKPRSLPLCEKVQGISAVGDHLLVGPGSHAENDSALEVYRGALPDRLSFDMAVDLCANGLSSSQMNRALHVMAKYVPNGAALGSVWTDLVDTYTQVATLGSLTILSTLMASNWAFSIGLHRHDDAGIAVDVRVRFLHLDLHNFHLCCLRVDDMKENLVRVLQVVCPDWKRKLVGISVAGDLLVTPTLSSTIEWLQSSVPQKDTVWITWNGNDLVRRAFYQFFHQLQDGSFATTFRTLKTCIKSQPRLLQEIGHESPTHPTKEEESMEGIVTTSRWLSEKRVRIRKFLEEECESTTSRPSESWWLCLSIFDWIATPTNHLIQSVTTQLGGLAPKQQIVLLEELDKEIAAAFRVTVVDSASESTVESNVPVTYVSENGICSTTKTGMLEFIVDLGSFVNSLLTSLGHDELDITLMSLGTSIANFVETLRTGQCHGRDIVKQREPDLEFNVANAVKMTVPPVLPQELAKLNGKEFSALLNEYRPLLLPQFSEEDLDAMDQEHLTLKRASRDKSFREWTSEDAIDRRAQFDAAWASTMGRFRKLHAFAGGLASVLPPDDSLCVLAEGGNVGKPHTMGTLDIAKEASLHAAQFHALERLRRLPAM